MSRNGLHLTEDEFSALLAQRATRLLKTPEIQIGEQMAKHARRGRGGSKLEAELAGHLSVMGMTPETQFQFHPERKWRLDFAFPDELVAVEIDGGIFAAENGATAGKHARGAGRCKDMEKRNAAAELGWLVLNYGPPHVRSGEAALQIERLVVARRASVAAGVTLALVRELDGGSVNQRLKEQHARKPRARRRRETDSPAPPI